jgi:hypothetical protein
MISEDRLTPQTRHAAWHAMKVLSAEYGHYTIRAVTQLAHGANRLNITAWTNWLVAEDVVTRPAEGRYVVTVAHACPPAGRMLAGRFGRAQHQMWRAMRSLRSFNVGDLVEAASTDDQPVSREAAGAYCSALEQAGVLAIASGRGWRLKPGEDTGPRAPVLVGRPGLLVAVFDLNRGASIELAPAASPQAKVNVTHPADSRAVTVEAAS